GGVPDDVPEVELTAPMTLLQVLRDGELAPSNKEARRLLQQGAVSIDGERVDDPGHDLAARPEPYLLKVGKRRFLRVTIR
ncbi:MAG: tyrosine--tRNA ligase, partial [Acidobacteria bacterium]|nr:tyrosine--tRNA ligase [Acidobacteriota bacterium]